MKFKFSPSMHKTNLSIFCLLFSLYINLGLQIYASLSVGMWKGNGNPNPCTELDKIVYAQGRFWCSFDPGHIIPWAWGPETLTAEGHIFENCLQNKRC